MLSRRLFCKLNSCPTYPLLVQLTRSLSLENMTIHKWMSEKDKILKLNLEDKRRLYATKDFVTLDQIETWDSYVKRSKMMKPKLMRELYKEFQDMNIELTEDKSLSKRVSLYKGDITKLEIDAIVNAANSRLQMGGGVDRAIHMAAGSLLQEECYTLGGCPTGQARITGGYNLPAKYVIHTVGPQDQSEAVLESCYENCFAIMKEEELTTVAFPCIATGVYGFPNRLAAHVALRTARKALQSQPELQRIIFCAFISVDVEMYTHLMQAYFPIE